jgi:hypothetical protein
MAAATVSLLLDPDRLAVAGALAARSMATDDLIAATGRDRRTVLACVGDLRNAGLVVAAGDGAYELDVDALRRLARAQAEADIPMDPAIGFGMTADEREVLARYFSGRTLTEFPGQRSKQLIVLQRLALEFDPGRRYPESEVNEVLLPFSRDWSLLRRHLVDEGFLAREPRAGGNLYWRSGGRVTALPSMLPAEPPPEPPPG